MWFDLGHLWFDMMHFIYIINVNKSGYHRFLFYIYISLLCRYRRIFSVGNRGITTYNPSDREVTNQVGVLVFIFLVLKPSEIKQINTVW